MARANSEYAKYDMEAKAAALKLKGPWELLTVASLVQVEGKYKHDFDKVARVVYNRLRPDNTETVGRSEFDSTVNYLKGESTSTSARSPNCGRSRTRTTRTTSRG